MSRQLQKGFTLVELLVVIAIIGILSGILILAINPLQQIQRGRDTQRKSNLATIQSALELYRHDAGYYPTSIYSSRTSCTSDSLMHGSITYLQAVPCDPLGLSPTVYNGGDYLYIPYNSSNPSSVCNTTPCLDYLLIACLENSSDNGENTYSSTDISHDFPNFSSYITSLSSGCGSGGGSGSSSGRYYIVQNP